jgi:hypothetical protein
MKGREEDLLLNRPSSATAAGAAVAGHALLAGLEGAQRAEQEVALRSSPVGAVARIECLRVPGADFLAFWEGIGTESQSRPRPEMVA